MSMDDFPDFDDLDEFLDDDKVSLKKTMILVVSSREVFAEFIKFLSGDTYEIIYTDNQEQAISNLIQQNISLAFLDFDANIDLANLSASIHNYIPLCRIILITKSLNVRHLSPIINNGEVDAILPMPFTQQAMMNVLSQQEAKFSINKMLISMITEPPRLSQASFLLLDPTLQFGSEDQPLNFVGLMVVHNTVPKFTHFFEETLAQDEFLFAGYLSSISSLGKTLFESEEALREINFGGISVIFQFHGELQFFFFVRNLTKLNYEMAEERITNFAKTVEKEFGKAFMSSYLTDETYTKIESMANEFNDEDDNAEDIYEQKMKERTLITEDAPLLIYSRLQGLEIADSIMLMNELNVEDDFKILAETLIEENQLFEKAKDARYDVLMLDSDFNSGKRSQADFIDFLKEMSPSLQIIYVDRAENFNEEIISAFNHDTINYILPISAEEFLYYEVFKQAKRAALTIKQQSSSSSTSEISGTLESMKIHLREGQDAYTEEDIPILQGILIAEGTDVVFDSFWTEQEFDLEIIAGLVKSLEDIGGEMFHQKEEIQLLEIAGFDVFIKQHENYIFSFFVDNISSATKVAIDKEIEAICSIYIELLEESKGVLSYRDLHPIFMKLANETKSNFTHMLF